MLAAPAIQFKGSGWYVTDYAGKSTDGSSKEAKESKEAAESKPKETVAAKDSSKTPAKKAKEK